MRSFFCNRLRSPANYEDLTLFEMPDSHEYSDMDKHLSEYLERAFRTLDRSPQLGLSIEQLFPFVLYSDTGHSKATGPRMNRIMENAYRYIFTIYIDGIAANQQLSVFQFERINPSDQNHVQSSQYLIARLVSIIVAEDASLRLALSGLCGNGSYATTLPEAYTTPYHSDGTLVDESAFVTMPPAKLSLSGCLLQSMPKSPPNMVISRIIMDNATTLQPFEGLNLFGPVGLRSRVEYACAEGYRHRYNRIAYAECSDASIWTSHQFACEGRVAYLVFGALGKRGTKTHSNAVHPYSDQMHEAINVN